MQNIKCFYLLLILLIFSPDLICAQQTIKSASEYDYPPFSIVNEQGEADGFSVELLRASLKAAGLDVEFHVGPWAEIKQDLAKGKIQVLPLVGRTPERENIFDFSVPYKTNWTFAVKKGDKELLASLNNGLSIIITNGTFDKINDKWFGKTKIEKKLRAELTPEEKAFLASHPVITLGTDESWAPYAQKDQNGILTGIDSEIISLINQYTGTNIQLKTGKWADMVDKAKKGSIAGLSTSTVSKKREQYFAFTDIYVSDYMVLVTPLENTLIIKKLEDFTGKTLATQKGNVIFAKLAEIIPDVKVIQSNSVQDAVGLILEGKADACILAASTFPIQNRENLNSIKVSYVARELPIDLVFSIRKEWPQLVSIMNKGLDLISEDTMNLIYNEWFGISRIVDEKPPEKNEPFVHAKKAIQQKAEDVARQVEIYLNAYPEKTLKDLQNDPEFQKIAIQPVGKTGYTAISDYNNLSILFHPNKDLIGIELETLSVKYPAFWQLAQQAKGGSDVSGIYEFPDLDGIIKDKYLFIKIPKIKTADGVGMWVAATTYLDEYEKIELTEKRKEILPIIPLVWVFGILFFVALILLFLNKLNIIQFEKNTIIFFLSIALLLIIGLFVFNAYNITKNLKNSAIENYYDILRATASVKLVNIEQRFTHIKSSFKIFSSRKTISNEDLKKIVNFGEDFIEVFILDSNGKITQSSDLSHVGLSRSTDFYFKKAEEKIYIKPLYNSSTLGEVLYTISAPYKGGVLVARLGLNHIHEIISQKEGLGKSGESLLAYRDKNGDAAFFTERRFTAEAQARDIIPKEDINIPITQALLNNEKKFSNYVDYRNVPVFAVTKYIEAIDAGLVVKIDQKEAFESVSKNIKQIWYSTTGIIFAVIIIGMIFYLLLTYSLRREIKSKTNELVKASKSLTDKVILLQNSEKKLLTSEEQIKTSLKEKETLLRELYHRTKNNMQVIVSMINLQAQYIEDKNSLKIFEETTNKINSMALVHEKLYQTKDLSRINLKEYFNDLIELLKDSYMEMSEKVIIKKDLNEVMVTIDAAIPCGLIMNELISNIFKHAFPENKKGEIKISLKITEDEEIEIVIVDNGKGFPPGLDYKNTNTLGLQTAVALAEQQLLGSFEYARDKGTQFKILFRDQVQERI